MLAAVERPAELADAEDAMRKLMLSILIVLAVPVAGCRKKVDAEKTLECAANQPYKAEADCKKCCGGDFKLSDEVCLCYK
jgi:hypothetical protein